MAIFEVNLFAPLALVRALLPVLRQQRAGHVVHVSSIYGFVGAAGFSPTARRASRWRG